MSTAKLPPAAAGKLGDLEAAASEAQALVRNAARAAANAEADLRARERARDAQEPPDASTMEAVETTVAQHQRALATLQAKQAQAAVRGQVAAAVKRWVHTLPATAMLAAVRR